MQIGLTRHDAFRISGNTMWDVLDMVLQTFVTLRMLIGSK